MTLDTHLTNWKAETAKLPWGVKRVFRETFKAVADEQVHLVWGSDYRDGKPCLVNAVATMLGSTLGKGGGGIPTQHFGRIVGLFDTINQALMEQGVNKDNYVSPMAADILLHHFADVSDEPEFDVATPEVVEHPYIEPSDEALAAEWLATMHAPAPEDVNTLADKGDPVAQHLRGLLS